MWRYNPIWVFEIAGQMTCLAAIMPSNAAGVDYLLQHINLLLSMRLRNLSLPAGRGSFKSSMHTPLNEKPRAHATESMHMHSEDSTHTRLSLIRFRGTKNNGAIRVGAPPASRRLAYTVLDGSSFQVSNLENFHDTMRQLHEVACYAVNICLSWEDRLSISLVPKEVYCNRARPQILEILKERIVGEDREVICLCRESSLTDHQHTAINLRIPGD